MPPDSGQNVGKIVFAEINAQGKDAVGIDLYKMGLQFHQQIFDVVFIDRVVLNNFHRFAISFVSGYIRAQGEGRILRYAPVFMAFIIIPVR